MFKIKKGVPLAEIRTRANYPFAQMDVGDCFDAPRDMGVVGSGKNHKPSQDKRKCYIASAAYNYGKKHSRKFVTRIVDDSTVRCWRVA